jgi:hypothetical protein
MFSKRADLSFNIAVIRDTSFFQKIAVLLVLIMTLAPAVGKAAPGA